MNDKTFKIDVDMELHTEVDVSEQVLNLTKKFKEDLQKLEAANRTKTVWDLKKGNDYWITDWKTVYSAEWRDGGADNETRNTGNAFLTKKEALIEIQKREVEALLQKYGGTPFRKIKNPEDYNGMYLCLSHQLGGGVLIGIDKFKLQAIPMHLSDIIPFAFDDSKSAEHACMEIGDARLIAYATGKLFEND